MLTNWSYTFLALTHWYDVWCIEGVAIDHVTTVDCSHKTPTHWPTQDPLPPVTQCWAGQGIIRAGMMKSMKTSWHWNNFCITGPLWGESTGYWLNCYDWDDEYHEDVMTWKWFLHYWPFVRGIHWLLSPHKGPVMPSLDDFLLVQLFKKEFGCWWFVMPYCLCDVSVMSQQNTMKLIMIVLWAIYVLAIMTIWKKNDLCKNGTSFNHVYSVVHVDMFALFPCPWHEI